MPFLNLSENKKGANSMARRDQQIDASNFVYSFDRKIAPFLKITASKRALHGSEFANRRKKGVRIPPVRGKQGLASMESSVGSVGLRFTVSGSSKGQKTGKRHQAFAGRGDPLEIRTPDPLLKRQLLCQLS